MKYGGKAIMKELTEASVPVLSARVLARSIGIHHRKNGGNCRNEHRDKMKWQAGTTSIFHVIPYILITVALDLKAGRLHG